MSVLYALGMMKEIELYHDDENGVIFVGRKLSYDGDQIGFGGF